MRPLAIELEGFSTYRAKELVDFRQIARSDIAFFSLTGPTGSGKSSLVDAMIFALYGRIPRLGGRAVAPVISAGADRARVRLDFEVDGEEYTAVRYARRTSGGGATVKEARLEQADRVLADGADNVTRAVEELLKLGFDDFTRTVVLPQGEFARFLNATPVERQNLLRGLLGLDVYGMIRQLATNRHAAASARGEAARLRLESIDAPSSEDLAGVRARIARLEDLESVVAVAERDLDRLEVEQSDAASIVERLESAVERLGRLEAPPRVEEQGVLVAEAQAAVAEAEDAEKVATAEMRDVEAQLAMMPDPEALAVAARNHQALQQNEARLEGIDLDVTRARLDTAQASLSMVREEAARARDRVDALRVAHSAHVIAASLEAGGVCPVCRQTVSSLPEGEAPAEVTDAEALLAEAVAKLEEAEAVVDAARTAVTEAETTHGELSAARDELLTLLADAPPTDELALLEADIIRLKERLAAARGQQESAAGALEEARRRHEELIGEQRQMGKLLRAAHQAVADLQPPISESDDVVVEWKELLAWRDEMVALIGEEHGEAMARCTALVGSVQAARLALAEKLEEVGITGSGPFAAALAAETERARNTLVRQEETLAGIEGLRVEADAAASEAAVARALADHLRASRFEQWMMAGALEALVAGANGLLAELSDGGYSLRSEEGGFAVIDHRNADEIRPVSTLSGGETFLVSLALALSLSETHAAEGDARLDAVILDEGFGSLDDDTLDTVASVLEELAGSRGLMVGVITHVKELAERAMTRFEVVRAASGSTVKEHR